MRRRARNEGNSKGSLVVCFMACLVTVLFCPVAGHAAQAAVVDISESWGQHEGEDAVTYSVRNYTDTPIYSILIANPSWEGTLHDASPNWGWACLSLWHEEDESVTAKTLLGATVFTHLPDEFVFYSRAYLFYDTAGEPIGPGGTGYFLVWDVQACSPFVYTTSAIDLDSIPDGGFHYDGTGEASAVPLPASLLLLGPAFAAILAVKRRILGREARG